MNATRKKSVFNDMFDPLLSVVGVAVPMVTHYCQLWPLQGVVHLSVVGACVLQLLKAQCDSCHISCLQLRKTPDYQFLACVPNAFAASSITL